MAKSVSMVLGCLLFLWDSRESIGESSLSYASNPNRTCGVTQCRQLFESVNAEQLSRLTKERDASVSIQAFWSILVSDLRNNEDHRRGMFSPQDVARFCQKIEEKVCVKVPLWWKMYLLKTNNSSLKSTPVLAAMSSESIRDLGMSEYTRYDTLWPRSSPGRHNSLQGRHIWKSPQLQVDSSGNFVNIEVEGRKGRLGWRELFMERQKDHEFGTSYFRDALGANIVDGRLVVLSFEARRSSESKIFCFHQQELEWCQTVWAGGGDRSPSGGGAFYDFIHLAIIGSNNAVIHVFGVSPDGIYCEAFSTREGKVLLRFSSSCWEGCNWY